MAPLDCPSFKTKGGVILGRETHFKETGRWRVCFSGLEDVSFFQVASFPGCGSFFPLLGIYRWSQKGFDPFPRGPLGWKHIRSLYPGWLGGMGHLFVKYQGLLLGPQVSQSVYVWQSWWSVSLWEDQVPHGSSLKSSKWTTLWTVLWWGQRSHCHLFVVLAIFLVFDISSLRWLGLWASEGCQWCDPHPTHSLYMQKCCQQGFFLLFSKSVRDFSLSQKR